MGFDLWEQLQAAEKERIGEAAALYLFHFYIFLHCKNI
jgi:hypothetical protein